MVLDFNRGRGFLGECVMRRRSFGKAIGSILLASKADLSGFMKDTSELVSDDEGTESEKSSDNDTSSEGVCTGDESMEKVDIPNVVEWLDVSFRDSHETTIFSVPGKLVSFPEYSIVLDAVFMDSEHSVIRREGTYMECYGNGRFTIIAPISGEVAKNISKIGLEIKNARLEA